MTCESCKYGTPCYTETQMTIEAIRHSNAIQIADIRGKEYEPPEPSEPKGAECHRYPTPVINDRDYECGEYVPKDD